MTSDALERLFGDMMDPYRVELGEHFPLLSRTCGSLAALLASGERAQVAKALGEIVGVLRQHGGNRLHVTLVRENELWCARVYSLLGGLTFVHRELRAERPTTALSALARELEAPALARFSSLSIARTARVEGGLTEIVARYEDGRELAPVRGKSYV